ncbi:hypothetical protein ABZV24_01195 [Streptomyces sp. NPDC005251]|uniref:hypothetical protein n=1 Tax=Streptomyces sp. NPDC005251 TaxID=3157166 RepID=UPI0033B2C266
MASSPDAFQPTPPPTGSPLARDRGLRRSRRLTRWIAVTAVAGAAALGGLYTHLLPGAPASPPPASTPSAGNATTSSSSSAATAEHDDGGDDEGAAPAPSAPQPPAQPPAPSAQQPHTTTGAS